ncbi:MAG: hypothetical protein JW770_07255 [Actinobacteria bacterium]|nr:hypothetical protein [Actinomycetota bacterium]
MEDKKEPDKKIIGYIVGGAVLGAAAGYVASRIGLKNIMNVLKQKEIIPPTISKVIKEFSGTKDPDL